MKYNVISGTWKNPSPQTPLNLDSCNIIVGNNFSIQDDPHMWGPYPSIILKTYEVKRLLCTTHTRAKSSKMFGMELKTLIIRHLFWWYRKVHRLFLILRKIQQLTLILWKYMIKLMAKLNKQCHFAVWCVFSRERNKKVIQVWSWEGARKQMLLYLGVLNYDWRMVIKLVIFFFVLYGRSFF